MKDGDWNTVDRPHADRTGFRTVVVSADGTTRPASRPGRSPEVVAR